MDLGGKNKEGASRPIVSGAGSKRPGLRQVYTSYVNINNKSKGNLIPLWIGPLFDEGSYERAQI